MNEAPDKIYIPIHQSYPNAPIDENNTHLGADWYTSKCDYSAAGFHEYIHKDALLEWANEYKKAIEVNGDENDAYTRGEYSAINSLIDKINSLWKI